MKPKGSEKEYEKCINCKYYVPSPFPEYNGKLAICRGSSYSYKVGWKSLASRVCFEKREEVKKA